MTATHNDRVNTVVILGPAGISSRGFGTVLILADEASGTTLGGDRVRTYTSYSAVEADAAELGADAEAALLVAFSQPRKPTQVKVARVDTAAPETWAEGYAAAKAADPDFYGVVALTRTDANGLALAALIETEERFFVMQSKTADWLTTGVPAAFATMMAGYENSTPVYHDEDTEYLDVALAVNRLAWDPDRVSVPWSCEVSGVAAYTTGLTDTQKAFARTNGIQLMLPFGSSSSWVDPGENASGRPIYEILTKHWFTERVSARIANLKIAASNRGQKITVDAVGQEMVRSEIVAQLLSGESGDSPHFQPGQTLAEPLEITDADRTSREIRIRVQATYAVGALTFDTEAYFDTTLVFPE